MGGLNALLVIDEADAIETDGDRKRLAELIKYLSDSDSKLKVMVVGVAETGEEIIAAHPSVQRCLKETELRPMRDDEIEKIVTEGFHRLSLTYSDDVIQAIVHLSAGYPHFTHLIALKCAESAIAAKNTLVERSDLADALSLAVEDAEGTLRRVYDNSTRSKSDMYKTILAAAASLEPGEFEAAALRNAVERLTGKRISQGSLNNYYQRLVSEDGTRVLRRTGRGHYRFQDPRMASFVRIKNQML